MSPPRLRTLAWPLGAELVLGFGVGLVGLWLAARVSDGSAAAFGLANHVLGAFYLLFRVVSMGASVVITQQLGAAQAAAAQASARAALGASAWLGLGVAGVVALSAGPLLVLMQAPQAVAELATPYLRALALPLALDAGCALMAAVLRAHLRARVSLGVVLVTQAVHLGLCLPFMAQWGLEGFALAMAASRGVGLALSWAGWRRVPIALAWSDLWRWRAASLAPMLHIGLPGAAEAMAYRLAFLVSVAVVGTLGTPALAAHSYVWQIMNLIVLYSAALGFAGEILVGHCIGAGQFRQAHGVLKRSLVWGLGGSTLIALIAALTAPWLLRCFTADEQIIRSGVTLLWLNVLLEPGRTCNVVIINALRAAGDVRFPVLAGAASMLLVMAGGAWFLGSYCGLGLVGVWLAYAGDEWLRGLVMAARWFRLRWLGAARGVHARLRAQRARAP